jgi:hypothetical protein
MWLQKFQALKVGKLYYSVSGINLEPNYLTDTYKNLDYEAEERVILKGTLTIIYEDMNDRTYTNSVKILSRN